MTATNQEALDTVNSKLLSILQVEGSALLGYVPEVVWVRKEQQNPIRNRAWLRVAHQIAQEYQATLCTNVGQDTYRRWRTDAYALVEIFCSTEVLNSSGKIDELGIIIKNKFRGVTFPNGLWITEVKPQAEADEAGFSRFDVVIHYQYDSVG